MLFEGPQSPANSSPDREEVNFVKEAFKLQYNWISLAGAGVFAILSGSLLPILLAAGLELMYLAIVPQNWRFQRLVRSWKLAEKLEQNQQQFAELLSALPSEARGRYTQLAQICASVRMNFSQLSSTSQIFLQQMDARLDGLLRGYARTPVTNLRIRDCKFDNVMREDVLENVKDIALTNVTTNGKVLNQSITR